MRWGIVGTGAIAAHFAVAAHGAGSPVTAVASRREETGRAFATRFGIAAVEGGAAALAARDDVDAVYVATPNAAHEADALAVIAAGKAVLCEKPLAPDAPSARRIAEAARAAQVFCMEGMWSLCLPVYRTAFARLAAGEIGTPLGLRASFCVPQSPDAMPRLHDGAAGGGALLDRGVYLLALAQAALGPLTLTGVRGAVNETGADLWAELSLDGPGGVPVTLTCAIDRMAANRLEIDGSHGRLLFDEPVTAPAAHTLRRSDPDAAFTGPGGLPGPAARLKGALRRQPHLRALAGLRGRHGAPGGLADEIREVEACLAAGRTESELVPLDGSIAVLELIDAARARLGAPAP